MIGCLWIDKIKRCEDKIKGNDKENDKKNEKNREVVNNLVVKREGS